MNRSRNATFALIALLVYGQAAFVSAQQRISRIFLPVVNQTEAQSQPQQQGENCHMHGSVQYCHDGPTHDQLDRVRLTPEELERVNAEAVARTEAIIARSNFDRARSAESADNATFGAWTTPQIWKDASNVNQLISGLFVSLLPNGKVAVWDTTPSHTGGAQDNTQAMVYDPATNRVVRTDLTPSTPGAAGGGGSNLFCAGYAKLPDGTLFIAGGNRDNLTLGIRKTYTFNYTTQSWQRTNDMREERWYPSVAPLANGEMLILGGLKESALPEVRETNGNIRALSNISTTIGPEPRLWRNRWYPFIQLAPNGNVAYLGPDDFIGQINTVGAGQWISATGGPIPQGKRDGVLREYGSYVLHDAVNGQALVNGGESSRKTGAVVDLNKMNGTVNMSTSAAPMTYGRRQHQLIVLADGKVLAIGGIQNYTSVFSPTQLEQDRALVDLRDTHKVLTAELWTPGSGGVGPGSWQIMAAQTTPRQYHSAALLMPDGRVLSTGGAKCGPCETPITGTTYINFDYEFYSPPYLFAAGGGAAARPVINFAPAEFGYGQQISIVMDSGAPVARTTLIRLGSNTHSVDFEQRFLELQRTQNSGSNQVTISTPANANLAPPGYYMLFALNSNGTPSIAKIVRVRDGAASPGATPTPSPTAPATSTPTPTLTNTPPPNTTPTFTPTSTPVSPTPTVPVSDNKIYVPVVNKGQ